MPARRTVAGSKLTIARLVPVSVEPPAMITFESSAEDVDLTVEIGALGVVLGLG